MSFIKPKEQPAKESAPQNESSASTSLPATPKTGMFVAPKKSIDPESGSPRIAGDAPNSEPQKSALKEGAPKSAHPPKKPTAGGKPFSSPQASIAVGNSSSSANAGKVDAEKNHSSTPSNFVVIPATAGQDVSSSSTEILAPVASIEWEEMGLAPELIQLLRDAGMKYPTPVQAKSIPEVLDQYDLVVSAQTGTGKTAAFALPVIEKLKGRNGTSCVVLCPTREIALQTQKVFEQFGKPFGINAISLIGGTPLRTDEVLLRDYPQVIIATPGRVCDHIERGTIWLEYLEILILDEADRMLDMGFSTQLNMVLAKTPDTRQTLLFSATLDAKIEKLAQTILYDPIRIEVGKSSRSAPTIEQRFVFMSEEEKFVELEHLLYENPGSTFVFTRSKESAAGLWRKLRNRGFHQATQLHSNLEQNVREEALDDFKSGKYRVMIATDVMGRGIHVDDVAHVINYDFPRDAEDYIHRIGRTGRAESSGVSTSIITPRDYPCVKDVEKLIGKKILHGQDSRPSHPGKPQSSRHPSHQKKRK